MVLVGIMVIMIFMSTAFAQSQKFSFNIQNVTGGRNTATWTAGTATCTVTASTINPPGGRNQSYRCYLQRSEVVNSGTTASSGVLVADGKQKVKNGKIGAKGTYYPLVANVKDWRGTTTRISGEGTWKK